MYVGRTTNLTRRYLNHPHLTDDIKRIEYIECKTAADMAWKEIYYINFFANEFTTNDADLYQGGVTDLHLNDEWKLYDRSASKYIFDKERIINNQKLTTNPELISKIDLIHIIDHDKLNSIGEDKYALSKKWFYDKNKNLLEKLGKHTTNYFHNICKAKSADCLWTTFDETKSLINGQCFRKGFISLNNDEDLTDRIYLAFLCNLFYPTNDNIEGIAESNYALSEMLQFIWRSAIRDGKEIWIYVPSIRMRNLLKQWIKENLPQNNNKSENKPMQPSTQHLKGADYNEQNF